MAGYEDIVGAQEFKIQGCQGNYFITYRGHVIPVWLKYAPHRNERPSCVLNFHIAHGYALRLCYEVFVTLLQMKSCEQDFVFRSRIKFRPRSVVGECLSPSLSKISLADCLSFHAELITAAEMSLSIFERFRRLHSYSGCGLAVAPSFYRI